MATEREVKYKISADADGGEKIKKLADEIVSLVKTGGDATPIFKEFATELDKLANQNELIKEFDQLESKTNEVQSAFQAAQAAAESSSKTMRERARDLEIATEAEKKSREAVASSNAEILESQVGLRKVKAELAEYKAKIAESGEVTDQQKIAIRDANIELRRYQSSLAAAKSGLDLVLPAQKENAATLKAAQAELSKATVEYNRNSSAVSRLEKDYKAADAALAGVADKMTEAGLSTSDLTSEYIKINASVQRLTEEFKNERDALQQKIASERASAEATRQADQAYKEKIATLRAQAQVLTAAINNEKVQNQIALDSARITLELAKSKRDEKAVAESLIEIKKLESQEIEIQSRMLRQEAESEDAIVIAKYQHLNASNRLTEAAKAEIAAEQLAIKSKREMADATNQLIQAQSKVTETIANERDLAATVRLTESAYKEKIATLRAESSVMTESISLTKAQTQASLAAAKADLDAAKSKGEKRAISEATARVLRIESELTQLQAQTLRQEASAEQLVIAAKQEHLVATGQMTAALSAEIQAERLAIQSKLALAQANERNASSQLSLSENVGKTGSALSTMTGFVRGAIAPVAALVATFAGGTEFVRVNVELENVARTLRVVAGSSAAARQEMTFVKQVSNELGLELTSTAKAYAQFSAATKGSSLAGEQTRFIFQSVAAAMSAAGRSAAETEGALNALGQMVSKGVVQMEELRGQLGDRLPGAMKIAAESSGLTTDQLIKMIESGKVLAEDLLPKLAVGLRESFKDTEKSISTTTQEWNRFRNAISETFEQVGDSGVLKGLLSVLNFLAGAVVSVGAGFNVLMQSVGAAILFIINTIADFIQLLDPWGISIEEFTNRVKINFNAVGQVTESAMDQGATAIKRFTERSSDVAKKTDEMTESAKKAEQGWLALTAQFTNAQKNAEALTDVATKQVEVRKEEAKTISELNSLRGDENAKLSDTAESTKKTSEAFAELSKRRLEELQLLKNELDAKKKLIEASNDQSSQHKKQVEELQKLIDVKKSEYDASVAQAKSSELVAIAARAEMEAHKDNSSRVSELRDQYIKLVDEVATLREKQAQGIDVSNQLAKAERDLAAASRLYKDAVEDQVKAINNKLNLKQSENNLAQLGIKLALEAAKTEYEVATALGDQRGAREAANEMRKLEIELAKLQAQLLKAEAEAALEMVKVKREEAKARGELTKQMEMELRVEELSAQAKQKQSQIQEQVAGRLEKLADITNYSTQSINENTDAANQNADGLDNAAKAADNLANSYSNAANSAGRLGNAQSKANNRRASEGNTANEFTATAETVESLTKKFMDVGLSYGAARVSAERLVGKQTYVDVEAEVEKARAEIESQKSGYGGIKTNKSDQGSTQGGSLKTVTVNVNLGGKTTTINTASENDAQALVSLFGQLSNDKARAN